jgi:hypothetical protein
MRQSLDVGFNSWTIFATAGEYGKKVNDLVLERGGVVALWSQFSPINYPIHGGIPAKYALGQLMLSIPEFRARYFDGNDRMKTTRNFCRSYATSQGAAKFKEAVKKDIASMLHGSPESDFIGFPKASIYFNNWEGKVWEAQIDKSICFCENCKKAFRQFANLPDGANLTDDAIFKQYKREWSLFRNQLDGRMNGIVREACNELGLKYLFYDDVFNQECWAACRGKLDIAFPGWPGSGQAVGYGSHPGVGSFNVTQRSLDDVMSFFRKETGMSQIQGQLFAGTYNHSSKTPWANWSQDSGSTQEGFLNSQSVKAQILRIIATFHGGVDLNSSIDRCAGQHFYIGEATRLIAEYEDLFYDGKREDSLAESEQLKYPNLLVLTKGDERLVLLFNETDVPVTVQLNNKTLKSGQTATVFGSSDKIGNPRKMSVTVGAGDVAAVHIN